MKELNTLNRRSFLGCSGLCLGLAGCSRTPKAAPAASKTRLVDAPQVKRDFDKDGRSKKVVFAAHCILNQNARHYACADFPSMMKPLMKAFADGEIGVVQLPCPEFTALGLGRDRDVPPLDSIREGLGLPEAQAKLIPFIDHVIFQIKDYQWQGFKVIGILGKNGSPSCGVETTYYKSDFGPGEGVFIRMLRERLQAEKLDIAIKGVDDHRQEEAIRWMQERA